MEKLKVLLTGHGGSTNRGCEAILRCTLDILQKHLRCYEPTVISWDADADRIAFKDRANELRIVEERPRLPERYSVRWLLNGIERRLRGMSSLDRARLPHASLKRQLGQQPDVLVHIGGDNFCYNTEEYWFEELRLARAAGVRTVIWAASFDQFRPSLEEQWANELRAVDLITVRDGLSLHYLQSLGVAENVRRVADPAFLLTPCPSGALAVRSGHAGTVVGIGISGLCADILTGRAQGYFEAFAALCEYALLRANTRVLLIPHVFGRQARTDDGAACAELQERLGSHDRVSMVGAEHNACQMKYVISQCDFFIGARTHSTIASLSSGVPTLSIAYSRKAYGINEDLYGHTNYVLPCRGICGGALIEAYERLRRDRQKIIGELTTRSDRMRDWAMRGGSYLAAVLGNATRRKGAIPRARSAWPVLER